MSTSVRFFQGLPVHDATKPIVVKIEAKDLSGGYTRQPNYCAVHHALCREQHKPKGEVFVHSTKAYIMDKSKKFWWRYQMSNALRIQVAVHDQGGIMHEGEYRLNVVSKSSRLDTLREASSAHNAKRRQTAVVKRTPQAEISTRERPHYNVKE